MMYVSQTPNVPTPKLQRYIVYLITKQKNTAFGLTKEKEKWQ